MMKLRLCTLLPATLLMLFAGWQAPALAASCTQGSTCVTVEGNNGGDGVMTKEQARQSKEQWDETKSLRSKVNARNEKEFDKRDKAIDGEERCNDSYNVNAYWEAATRKCLDRKTGRPVN